MKFKHAILAVLSFIVSGICVSSALAVDTHSAKIEMDLQWVSPSGSSNKLDSTTANYKLDWDAGTCLATVRTLKATCKLDHTQDLKDASGNLLVHEMPVSHFDQASLDSIIIQLGQNDQRTKDIIARVISDTSASRAGGFDLPTYTCEKCTPGSDGIVTTWNAYDSFVMRTLEINHPLLQGKKLVLRMKLRSMNANKRAFDIIGDNASGNFGSH